ncbi:hypothetical protein PR202_gb17111 [Eleusine coracana subsp. coracana]|uniref:Plant heme peroxidase family profile domain-containing protein n=1 Tax=Eleusine coracana subsp. coracana TaxID=191504 RepID=A0AAV5F3T1_ELECO|nr:hypothetical protein PR202_gb17111 [Eleusine coracana subsp. coracana]
MAIKRCVALFLPVALLLLASISPAIAQLVEGYYSKTCPNVEAIVREEMEKIIGVAPSLAGPLLRLHFHDCFVRGCDASVLLNSTKNNLAESYYRHVSKRRGLFQSDAALLTDATTRDYVQRIATGKFDREFFKDFSESMTKMGNVGVLTGAQGEIRKKCYVPNY